MVWLIIIIFPPPSLQIRALYIEREDKDGKNSIVFEEEEEEPPNTLLTLSSSSDMYSSASIPIKRERLEKREFI
jgi:hypothetical protein